MPKQPAIAGLRETMMEKVRRREMFLTGMDEVLHCTRVLALIEAHYPRVVPKAPPQEREALEDRDRWCYRQKRASTGDEISRPYDLAKLERIPPTKPYRNEDALYETAWAAPHGARL